MPGKDDYNKQQYKAIQTIGRQVEYFQKQAELAREKGNCELVRQWLERKRHLQNRLAFLSKAHECDEIYLQKRRADGT